MAIINFTQKWERFSDSSIQVRAVGNLEAMCTQQS